MNKMVGQEQKTLKKRAGEGISSAGNAATPAGRRNLWQKRLQEIIFTLNSPSINLCMSCSLCAWRGFSQKNAGFLPQSTVMQVRLWLRRPACSSVSLCEILSWSGGSSAKVVTPKISQDGGVFSELPRLPVIDLLESHLPPEGFVTPPPPPHPWTLAAAEPVSVCLRAQHRGGETPATRPLVKHWAVA